MSHAVARLRAARLAASSKPFVARGGAGGRCSGCRLPHAWCVCDLQPQAAARAGVCLLMGDIEMLKPSNTGWLIADVVPDTWAFAWQRTQADPALLALLADPQWQPYVVFPGEFVEPARVVASVPVQAPGGRRPLFVLLDGTWSEARKMFRKSPYLDGLPVLSLQPGQLSRYRLRRSAREDHFCTAEVAALCLELAGDEPAAERLDAWFDVFSHHYLSARRNLRLARDTPVHARLAALTGRAPLVEGDAGGSEPTA
ncbi:tRNA-uridine aminocarboxypropyltransferase [Hydrogenophaga electricum]|uniref:tRNA-uridine aminocarboxypropyltransferase n=1 Tax=Hydrogenophaga electricum TaxID=1230953 RepID=A0ABQ6C4R3_9BURK|nr:tRNA-uridine aminocarboxypropyltransferase [Hydrogenophaga electricum]GLS13197.1 DTW domain-containing protein [Hydrogenophaga electricum]